MWASTVVACHSRSQMDIGQGLAGAGIRVGRMGKCNKGDSLMKDWNTGLHELSLEL